MYALRYMGGDIADHRRLDRAYIRHNGAGRQMGAHLGGQFSVRAHRRAQHDEVGTRHGFGQFGCGTVDDAEFKRLIYRFLAARDADDFIRQLVLPYDAGNG